MFIPQGASLTIFTFACFLNREISFPAIDKYTPPIAEILCVKNGRAIVVCGFLMKSSYINRYAESLKKIVGAIWELPTK